MSKIKGKKLYYSQRVILEKKGIKDSSEWLFVKTEIINNDGSKHVGKSSGKITYMIIQNKATEEIKKVEV